MPEAGAWMPMYWADYLGDTMHLSTEEHGAYLLLIATYWRRGGPLPDDDHYLANVVKMTRRRFKFARDKLTPFFDIHDDAWHHKRVDHEILKSSGRLNSARKAGSEGGKKRSLSLSGSNETIPHAGSRAKKEANSPPNPQGLQHGESNRNKQLSLAGGVATHNHTIDSSLRSESSETPSGVPSPDASTEDLDAIFYKRGKALLGRKAGGQLTKLRDVVGLGRALEVIDAAQHKESPAEYVAAVIRNRRTTNGVSHGRSTRPSSVEALRRLREIDQRREERFGDDADDGPSP